MTAVINQKLFARAMKDSGKFVQILQTFTGKEEVPVSNLADRVGYSPRRIYQFRKGEAIPEQYLRRQILGAVNSLMWDRKTSKRVAA